MRLRKALSSLIPLCSAWARKCCHFLLRLSRTVCSFAHPPRVCLFDEMTGHQEQHGTNDTSGFRSPCTILVLRKCPADRVLRERCVIERYNKEEEMNEQQVLHVQKKG